MKQGSLNQTNSNISLYSLYYAEACHEFAGPIFMSLRLQVTQLFSKKCRSFGEPLQHCVRFDRPEI